MDVTYAIESELTVEEFVDVLKRSTLAERRPVDDLCTMTGMLTNADIIVTARVDSLLVGVARSVSDFHYCTCLLYTSPSPRDRQKSRMPSSA